MIELKTPSHGTNPEDLLPPEQKQYLKNLELQNVKTLVSNNYNKVVKFINVH